jgi:hypothetical protein
MAINKIAKNIIIATKKQEINISKVFIETADEKYVEATNGNLILTSVKKIVSYGNTK